MVYEFEIVACNYRQDLEGNIYIWNTNSTKQLFILKESSMNHFGTVEQWNLDISGKQFKRWNGPGKYIIFQCTNPPKEFTEVPLTSDSVIEPPVNDMVHHPKHYEVFRGIEAKDVMEVVADSKLVDHLTPWEIHCFMTMLKYRLRVGNKDNVEQELGKAERYKECLKK